MGKRHVYLHVGPPATPAPGLDESLVCGTGDIVEQAIAEHREALAELGVRTPVEHPDEMFRAAIEITRTHKEWGFKRKEVEGAWAELCRRVLATKGKDAILISQPLLAAADRDQADLLLDQLPGTKRHVIVTARDEAVAQQIAKTWEKVLGKPERIHVVTGDLTPKQTWKRIGKIVGFGTASLPVEHLAEQLLRQVDGSDAADMSAAMVEMHRLARRNDALERQLEQREKKIRKQRKLLKRSAA